MDLALKNIKASKDLELPERQELKHWLDLMAAIVSDVAEFGDFGTSQK